MRFVFQSATGPPLLASPSFSPQGNTQRSLSDFSVMELQDKLDLVIHPYRWPGGLNLPPLLLVSALILITGGLFSILASQEKQR